MKTHDRRGHIWNGAERKRIRKLWNEGFTQGEIARLLGVSRNSIAGLVSRMRKEGQPMHWRRENA